MPSGRVAATVVTGFLGSGKTTLLAGLLRREAAPGRIAVIVNELGEIGIDGRVLAGFEFIENIVELESGCVCCSIDEYRFDLAVDELVRRLDPALLVLETTGVADPGPTLERLRRCGLGVDSVVTVVDATAWHVAWRISRTARRQIAAADFLVISKCDLVPAGRIARLRARLARSNPRAKVLECSGSADFAGAELLLATSAARVAARRGEFDGEAAGAGGHLADERLESFTWQTRRSIDRARLERILGGLPPGVVRGKGLVKSSGERIAYLFQLVCGRVEMSGCDAAAGFDEGAQGVFLGPGVLAMQGEILARLATCETASGGEPAAATGSVPREAPHKGFKGSSNRTIAG